MKYIYLMSVVLVFVFSGTQASAFTKLAGVAVPEVLQYRGKTMVHNGSGIRKKYFVKLYVGSLYLSKKSNDVSEILTSEDAKALRLVLISNHVSISRMKQSMLKGLNRVTNGDLAPIQAEVDKILAMFEKGVAVNDVFDLINVTGDGLHILKNGVQILKVRSPVFKDALFKVWLSKAALDAKLRARLLGL